MKYAKHQKVGHSGNPTRKICIAIAVLIIAILGGIFAARHVYYQDLKPVSDDPNITIVTIHSGASSKQIASQLAADHLIRSAWAFELYVHSKQLTDQLQAGTYALSPSSSTGSIIDTITKGKVTTKLVTILPGRRIDQVRADLINDGFTPEAVDAALTSQQYSDLPVLAFKPAGASLEGLLFPDSFQRTAETDPSFIIRESLTEMGQHLTSDLQAAFAREQLTTYQGITLASMVEREVSKSADRAQAAQVFITRLQANKPLGSDVTALYGAILAGKTPSSDYDSVYNTRHQPGLPPTPVSTVSDSSLQAVAHPASTNWQFFVSGDDGTTYFSTTQAEHDAQTQKYCHKNCAQ